MNDFDNWFGVRFPNIQATIDQTNDQESKLLKLSCKEVWQKKQAEIDSLKTQLAVYKEDMQKDAEKIVELQVQLKTWKGQSLMAMIHGTCNCGEPWQSIASDKEGFNRLHCFNCNNDRYENKEHFGDHEPKALRGDSK